MDIQKLIQILEIQTETYNQFRMFAYIIRQIKSIKDCKFYTHKGNVYITKGAADTYPCIVAHMDTVHEICEDLTAIKIGKKITGFNRYTMIQSGIGGDDKVGIFIALECLLLFDQIKIVFFRDEETGCEGSSEADASFFFDCNFVLQCDRQGNSDFVIEAAGVELSGRDFQMDISELLKAFGYSFSKGLMTDVMALKQLGIPCSMANISCGYYNPHTDYEHVNVYDIENCLNLVKNLIHEFGHIKYAHTYIESTKQFRYFPSFKSPYCLDCYAPFPTCTGYCEFCNEYYQFMKE